jgi:hypothetical protein
MGSYFVAEMNAKLNAANFVPELGESQPPSENNIGTGNQAAQDTGEHKFVMAPLSGAAEQIARGVSRHLRAANCAVVAELPLADGRRCDLMAVDAQGGITIVEIKSCLADYRSDQKWPDYQQWCDRFYFAVDADFPREIIPEECGLILADRFGAEILRESAEARLNAARRKAVMLRFARLSALRLQLMLDPEAGLPGAAY